MKNQTSSNFWTRDGQREQRGEPTKRNLIVGVVVAAEELSAAEIICKRVYAAVFRERVAT